MRVWEAKQGDWVYRIEEDLPGVGFCLRGYESGVDSFDYLQDTAETCISFANEKFCVSIDAWELIRE